MWHLNLFSKTRVNDLTIVIIATFLCLYSVDYNNYGIVIIDVHGNNVSESDDSYGYHTCTMMMRMMKY